jgi:Protein of unknown function (DUF2510)
MAIEQVQEWQSDPTGRHRFRLYADGRPTEWVSDGNAITEDRLAPADVRPAAVVSGPTPQPPSIQPWPVGTGEGPESAVTPVRPAGFYRNAAQPDEIRYWDGAAWSSPPADPAGDALASGVKVHHGAEESHGQRGPIHAVVAEEAIDQGAAADGEVPADWYPDPSNRARLRYWDGLGWTEQVLDERPAYS